MTEPSIKGRPLDVDVAPDALAAEIFLRSLNRELGILRLAVDALADELDVRSNRSQIRRSVHVLKSDARAAGRADVFQLCQGLDLGLEAEAEGAGDEISLGWLRHAVQDLARVAKAIEDGKAYALPDSKVKQARAMAKAARAAMKDRGIRRA